MAEFTLTEDTALTVLCAGVLVASYVLAALLTVCAWRSVQALLKELLKVLRGGTKP